MTEAKDKVIIAQALVELRAFALDTAEAVRKAGRASAHLVLAAIRGAEHFADTVEAFYGEIRTNERGLAKKIGAELSKDGDAFVVPGSIRAQVSQVLRAVKLGVDLGTADKPRSITDIRKESTEKAEEATATAAKASMSPEDTLRHALIEALADAIKAVKGAEGATLTAMRDVTVKYAEDMTALTARAAAAAEKATPKADGLPNGRAGGKGRGVTAPRSEAVAAAA